MYMNINPTKNIYIYIYLYLLFCFSLAWLCFGDGILLCSPGWSKTCDPPTSVSLPSWDFKHAQPHLATFSLFRSSVAPDLYNVTSCLSASLPSPVTMENCLSLLEVFHLVSVLLPVVGTVWRQTAPPGVPVPASTIWECVSQLKN